MRYSLIIRYTLLLTLAAGNTPAFAQAPVASPAPLAPASLNDLLQIAFSNHPSVQTARANLDAARARVAGASAAYWPQVSGDLSYTRSGSSKSTGTTSLIADPTTGSIISTGGGSSSTTDSYGVGLSLRQTIFDAGRTFAANSNAAAGKLQAEADYQQARLTVAFNVKQAYYALVAAQMQAAAKDSAVTSAQDNLGSVNARLRVGAIPRADLLQAQSDLANAQFAAVKAHNTVETARVTLAQALGRVDMALPPLANQLSIEPVSIQDDVTLQQAQRDRPDLQSQRASIHALEQALTDAYLAYGPSLSLSASERWQDNQFFPQRNSWSIGLSLSQPIFNGFQTQAQVDEARARLAAARSQENSLIQTIVSDVRQAIVGVRSADAEIHSAQAALAAAIANYNSIRGQYKYGLATQLQVSVAQNSLTTAQTNLTQAEADYLQAQARLAQATGRE